MSKHFRKSNIYLRTGVALIAISMAMLVAVFMSLSAARYLSGSIAGFCLVAGAVLYVIGRIAQVRDPCAQA